MIYFDDQYLLKKNAILEKTKHLIKRKRMLNIYINNILHAFHYNVVHLDQKNTEEILINESLCSSTQIFNSIPRSLEVKSKTAIRTTLKYPEIKGLNTYFSPIRQNILANSHNYPDNSSLLHSIFCVLVHIVFKILYQNISAKYAL